MIAFRFFTSSPVNPLHRTHPFIINTCDSFSRQIYKKFVFITFISAFFLIVVKALVKTLLQAKLATCKNWLKKLMILTMTNLMTFRVIYMQILIIINLWLFILEY